MKVITRNVLLTAMLGLTLGSCGGGDGGANQVAGGGISGTGTGTVTGFGSVIINDIRTFDIDTDTLILWDGNEITEQQLMNRGLGAVASVTVGDDVSADFTSGTAISIEVESLVKGPVTGTDPLQVLGQNVVITGSTVFNQDNAPNPGFDPATLAVGDIVEVNGFANSDNSILAALLETRTAPVAEWKLIGPVTDIDPGNTFNIGSQLVADMVAPQDCADADSVSIGEVVEVRATADDATFAMDGVLDTVTRVECRSTGLIIPGNATGTVLDAEIEALVTAINAADDFVVGGQRVVTNAGTQFEDGDATNILVGVRLEAEGDLDLATGILMADRIRFREGQVHIEAPLSIPGGGLGSTFQMLDTITIHTSALTRDEDGLLNGSGGISGEIQVEVNGFQDGNGDVFATELRERGSPDANDVGLSGPVGDTCNPAVADVEFDILAVVIDTGDGSSFVNDEGGPALTQQQFCDLAAPDTLVEVEGGSFSSAPSPRIDNADTIELED